MWCDDERNTTYRCMYNTDQHSMNTYVPVWKVLKQMYDEDKDNLYCYSTKNKEYTYNETEDESIDGSYFGDYCSDYETFSENYQSEDDEALATDVEDSSSITDESVPVVDCNSKFIYI